MADVIKFDTQNFFKSIEGEIREFRSQVPFATANTINDVTETVQNRASFEMKNHLDRPMPQTARTKGSMWRVFAKKDKLVGQVGFKDWAGAYLAHVIDGKPTRPKASKRYRIEPTPQTPGVLWNKRFGGLKRAYFAKDKAGQKQPYHLGRTGRLAQKAKYRRHKRRTYGRYFVGIPEQHRGQPAKYGVWERYANNTKIRMVLALRPGSRRNRKIYPFHDLAIKTAKRLFQHSFEYNLARAAANPKRR